MSSRNKAMRLLQTDMMFAWKMQKKKFIQEMFLEEINI